MDPSEFIRDPQWKQLSLRLAEAKSILALAVKAKRLAEIGAAEKWVRDLEFDLKARERLLSNPYWEP